MNHLPSPPRVAVLGGGLTGLTAAWHLRRAGCAPIVFEQQPRPGGAIRTLRDDGWLHELGPNSLLESAGGVAAFIEQVGLGHRRVYAAPAARHRYIVRDGRLVAAPASPLAFAGTRLFSWGAKLRLAGEPFRGRAAADAEESVADFVVRRLGQEFLDYAVNPLVGGVYAGDPARLSVRHAFPKLHALEQEHGSLIRGALRRRNTSGGPAGRIFSFPNGLAELPGAIALELGGDLRLNTTLRRVRRMADRWLIDSTFGGLTWTDEFAAVVCALPADALAALPIEGVPGGLRLQALREIEQPPVASVFMGFRRDAVAHPLDGFGALVPAVERRAILGTLFSSTLFAGRAPVDHVALTTFVGGMRNPDVAQRDDRDLLRTVRDELRELIGARGEPVYVHLHRWPRAIPQYTLGYARHQQAIAAAETAAPGLFIGGNCRDGISLANCVAAGARLAQAVQTHLAAPAAQGNRRSAVQPEPVSV